MYKALKDKLDKHSVIVRQKLGKRLRWQLRVLINVVEGRTTTYRVRFPADAPLINTHSCTAKGRASDRGAR